MFLGILSNVTSALNTALPFVTSINSNNKISNNSGVISLNKAGYYNIDCDLTVTGVQNDVGVMLYLDGNAIISSKTTLDASDDFDTVSISYATKVLPTTTTDKATITIVPTIAGASITGSIRIEYVQ